MPKEVRCTPSHAVETYVTRQSYVTVSAATWVDSSEAMTTAARRKRVKPMVRELILEVAA
jgi:hypothetical protein